MAENEYKNAIDHLKTGNVSGKHIELIIQALEENQQYEQIKWERDIAISQLEEIGVGLGQKMDDIKALKEKSVAKKPIGKETYLECPACGNLVTEDSYCQCGQYVK